MLLEQDLGSPLFLREPRGMVRSDAGRTLVDEARRAMLSFDRARAEISGTTGDMGGLVTLGLLPSTIGIPPRR